MNRKKGKEEQVNEEYEKSEHQNPGQKMGDREFREKSDSTQGIADARTMNETLLTVLDGMDSMVYVSDLETHEILFLNRYGRDRWGEVVGERCWEVLQENQSGPCAFCTNDKLLDARGDQTGVYVWEFQNTLDKQWYECRDQAILWPDNRLVRMETATNITERKKSEAIIKKHMREQNILLNVSQGMSTTLDLENVLQIISDGSAELLEIETTAVYTLKGEELYLMATTPPLDSQMPEFLRRAYLADHPHILKSISLQEHVILHDTELEELSPAEKEIVEIRNLRSLIYLPLTHEKEVIGVLILGTIGQVRDFTDHEIDLCKTMSNQLALGIQNSRLHEGLMKHAKELEDQISVRKQAEKELQESEEKHRTLFETMTQGVVYQETDGTISSVNPAAQRILGLTLDQMQGTTSIDPRWRAIHEDGSNFPGETHPSMMALKTGKKIESVVMGVFNPQREDYRWININAVPEFKPGEDTPYRVYTTFEDITDRKKAMEELRFQSLLLNQISDFIMAIDLEGRVTYTNSAFTSILCTTPSELIGQTADIFEVDKDDINNLRFIEETVKKGKWAGEWGLPLENGTKRIIDLQTQLIKNEDDQPSGLFAVGRDITDKKRADEQIKDSLREKEVLLKEIHHRVKNNLQIISSMLSLQSVRIKNEDIVDMFRESQNRIRSMAFVHEKMYRSRDLAKIDFSEYIHDISFDLFDSYGIETEVIGLEVHVEDILLGVDQAISCGLVINELLTNSLKHAFPDNRKGRISISLQSGSDNEAVLIVGDDGVGFPDDIDFRNTESLGMQLIITLINQLGGTIDIDRNDGTTFIIKFSLM